ncbi:L [Melampyrum roseum virus 1]|uniref:RNA-directed RNA polymerase n=1 Tax=Melampyrum roseum virus 1 TaxID=2793732 RepID=A0A8D9UJ34_9RHAB|nr:L [Melampyrum roseum virus 1] [Melampyrum roseum virus 1]DAF42364.1 TPA_asm: L [Melampyrum roseum virus 1]
MESFSFGTGLEDVNDEFVADEQMLIDFHLGNAINLDVVEKLVTGKFEKYKLHIPGFMIRSWDSLREIIPDEYELEVGCLEFKCRLFSLPSKRSRTSPTYYKQFIKIIGDALKKRKIDIPLAEFANQIVENDVYIKTTYDLMFKRIMKAITNLSEHIRGGKEKVYPEARIDKEFSRVHLLEGIYPAELIVGRNMSAMIDHLYKKVYIGNYDSVLLLLDTIGQRICLEVGCQMTAISKTNGTIDLVDIHRIIQLGDQVLQQMGNDGYEVIGMFEATVVSVILQQSKDEITDSKLFYDNCMHELIEIIGERPHAEELLNHWADLVAILKRTNSAILSNIFCIYRIWGHPRVDILAGMKKVYDKGTAEKNSLNQSCNVALCQFRHMFLSSYYNKKKKYPEITFECAPHGYVLERLEKGMPINPKNPQYNIWDYQKIEIGQIWTVPETYDVCHILNDKAVSPTRSELYDSVKSGKGTIAGTLRRGIIRWMEGDSIRCKEFLERVDQQGIDLDHLIIGMYEKEREIKVSARMFSLMSEQMRMYFVLTEELIANHILPYFPEITMKDPLNVQVRKIWKAGGKGQDPFNPNINIDFEKWNLNMRPSFTDGIFKQLDKMFGFNNLIARTHEIFENSYIYSCSGKYVPKINSEGFLYEAPMSYIGHKGGFEGLRQKGWTVATVALLSYTAWANKIQMNLLGQGDNQVLKLYMPIKKWENLCYTTAAKVGEAKQILNKYLQDMHTNFHDAGLPIKIRETWISSRLFMYGKTMYLDGICLPQWTKKLLRSYALSNEGTLTISGVVGTIATNMNAAASVSEHPDMMYAIYLFMAEWSLEYILAYHPFTRKRVLPGQKYKFTIPGFNRNKYLETAPMIQFRLMASLILIPTAVGGSVNIPLTGYILRGFPDHVSEGYAWLKLLAAVDSPLQSLFFNWYTFLCNPSIQSDMLIQSPWSINHLKPPTPGIQSRELVRNWLLSGRFSKNKFLKSMNVIDASFDRKAVCQELVTDPMNPLVMYEVYNAFPHTYYDGVLRRFEGTRSVRKLAMRENYTTPIVSKLMTVETNYTHYLIWRAEQLGEKYSDCATEQARMARNIGWGRTIQGLTTPHPIEFLFNKLCHGYSPDCDGSDFILARFSPNGNYPPYLGSRVRTKVISLQDESARVEPLICANARLARYLKWLNAGPNLFDVILKSTQALCKVDIYDNFFDDYDGGENYTGCVEHRFNPAAASDGCFINYVPQIGSKVYLSGDHMPKYGKGRDNYTLHFQAVYCFLQYVTAMSPISNSTHHHISCESCIVKCDDEISDISLSHPAIDKAFDEKIIPTLRSTIGYITEKPLVISGRDEPELSGNYSEIAEEPYVNTRSYYGVLCLLAVRCASSILLKSYNEQGLGIDDLQAFPRVYAYKFHTDHILKATAEMIVFMQALYTDDQPSGIKMTRIKRQSKRSLDNATLDKFKEIGSLCLGRTWSHKVSSLDPIPCSSYPESPEGFLRATRYALSQEIDSIASFEAWIPRIIALPLYDCTERELKLITGIQIYRSTGCWNCGKLGTSLEPMTAYKCRLGHVQTWINNTTILKATLDRMVKLASIKRTKLIEIEAIPYIGSTKVMASGELPEYFAGTSAVSPDKEFRKINLPTASIYKWTSIISTWLEKYENVIVIGDGTGGTSLIASIQWPEAIIHPLSKMESYRAIPQDSTSLSPFLSRGCHNVNCCLMYSIPDDINDITWEMEIAAAIDKMNKRILFISDLEQGAEIPVHQIIKGLSKNLSFDYIIKRYRSDYQVIDDEFILTTQHANVEYGEIFVSNNYPSMILPSPNESIRAEMNKIEKVFEDVCQLSLFLSQQHIAKNYINIPRTTLLSRADRLLMEVLTHVNARYRFPQDRIKFGDKRNLTDGVLMKIVRAIKIILLSLSHESLLEEKWFKELCLIRCNKKNRIRGLEKLKIILTANRPNFVELVAKDIQAARTIRAFREDLVKLSGIEDVYKELIYPWLHARPIPLIPLQEIEDTDPIETLGDLGN